MKHRIAISLAEGRVVRDLFENGFLDLAREQNLDVLCFTPSARVPEFTAKWRAPHVQFHLLKPYVLQGRAHRLIRLRDSLIKHGKWFVKIWGRLQPYLFIPDPDYVNILGGVNLAVLTNPLFYTEMGLYIAANSLRIPTLGIVRSWDNLYKGFRIHPDQLAVWNPLNRLEAMNLLKYDADRVKIVGAPQFDPYFGPDSDWGRERFARSLNLDPSKPILTLATLGAFLPQFDETYLVDILLGAIQCGDVDPETQLIIRLHPASKLEYFSKYKDLPNVRLSYITGYIPTLGWTMSREDVVFIANLLRHSDVVISPGSTITIETAIFDTPTIVPIFSDYQPELYKDQYNRHLSTHFKRLADLDLIPILHEKRELIPAVKRALQERSWYQTQRAQLVQEYIHFTDGQSLQRLLDLILKLSGQANE